MAEKLKLLSFLWLVIACIGNQMANSTMTMPTSDNSTVIEPPTGNSTVTVPPTGNSTVTEPPTGNSTVTLPPTVNSTVTEPPTGNSTVTLPPTGNSTVTEPPTVNSTVTEPPTGNSTVTLPPTGNSTVTVPPTGNSTVTVPPTGNSTVTVPPTGNSTVTVPPTGNSTVTVPPSDNSTVTVPPSDNSTVTVPPTDNSTVTVPPTDNSTIATPPPTETDPCSSNPCGQGSTCEMYGNHSFVCFCLPGDNYNYERKSCENAQIFPGHLGLPDIQYITGMEVKGSLVFLEASKNITTQLTKAFNSNDLTQGFSNVTVLEIKKLGNTRDASGINATVDMIFLANSGVQTANIEKVLRENDLKFKEKDLCDDQPCDEETTICEAFNGNFECQCMEDYVKSNLSNRLCTTCSSGFYAFDKMSCEKCPFGYTGLNCKEHWLLALVIVASVLGGMLLICLILLPLLSRRSSKKSSKKSQNVDLGKPYVSHSPAKSPLVYSNSYLGNSQQSSQSGLIYGKEGVPEIPRAKATSIWDRTTNLEMPSRNNRQNTDRVSNHDYYDDMNSHAQSQPQSEHSAFVRPRNPYVQNRPPFNPYSQSQGNNNPSFVQDNGRYRN